MPNTHHRLARSRAPNGLKKARSAHGFIVRWAVHPRARSGMEGNNLRTNLAAPPGTAIAGCRYRRSKVFNLLHYVIAGAKTFRYESFISFGPTRELGMYLVVSGSSKGDP